MTLTLAQALQFYAPLAGLLAVVFWLGVLSNRVATLEREHRERKALEKEEGRDGRGVSDRLLILETNYQRDSKATTEALSAIRTELIGIHRMIANTMKPTGRRVKEFDPTGGLP